MKLSWFEERKDIFIRDLCRNFMQAQLFFNNILASFHASGALAFSLMDSWVGTESNKGPLWFLKDQSHLLFRNDKYKTNLYERLFDWTIGSIFHESMKLKEDAYQIESYKPLLELEAGSREDKKELSRIIKDYFSLIEKSNKNLKDELAGIAELFSRAAYHLRAIVPSYRDNMLLLRLLLDNKDSVEKLFGKNSLHQILLQMYPEGTDNAYMTAAEHCIKNGWDGNARIYLQHIIKSEKINKSASSLMSAVKKRVEQPDENKE